MGAADDLSLVFQALADPTRRAMISHLSAGSTTVGELAAPFETSRPAISQHLNVLERAGLIERTVDGQWRRCTLRTEPLDEAAAWVERHRAEWNARFGAPGDDDVHDGWDSAFDVLDERIEARGIDTMAL